MSNTFRSDAVSNPATQFTEALAAASGTGTPPFVASALYNLVGLPAQGSGRWLIRAIEILTTENWGPEVNLFSSASGFTASVLTDKWIGRWGFTSAMGEQIGGSGLWRYYVDGLAVQYYDLDTIGTITPPTVHAILQNIDTVAKSAYPTDLTKLTISCEPCQSF
jgi:hypothetical protein